MSTTFPGSDDLPLVTTGGHTINAEAVLALRPTLVITDGTIGPRDVIEQLREAGIDVVFVDARSVVRRRRGARPPGRGRPRRTGRRRPARGRHPGLGRRRRSPRSRAIAPADPADRVRVMFLYLRGGAGVYYLFGEESGADELIAGLSAVDVAAEIGWTGMKPMTDEALVAADPDLVLVMTDGLASAGGVDGLLESHPALALTDRGPAPPLRRHGRRRRARLRPAVGRGARRPRSGDLRAG